MGRTQIQLDGQIYRLVRRCAYQPGKLPSAVVREALAEALGREPARRPALKDFKSVGIGRSRQGAPAPVSARNDEGLIEAVDGWKRRTNPIR